MALCYCCMSEVNAQESVCPHCHHAIPYKIAPRRDGDIAANWADPTLAERKLGWKAVYDIDAMCRDAWNFQQHLENEGK